MATNIFHFQPRNLVFRGNIIHTLGSQHSQCWLQLSVPHMSSHRGAELSLNCEVSRICRVQHCSSRHCSAADCYLLRCFIEFDACKWSHYSESCCPATCSHITIWISSAFHAFHFSGSSFVLQSLILNLNNGNMRHCLRKLSDIFIFLHLNCQLANCNWGLT